MKTPTAIWLGCGLGLALTAGCRSQVPDETRKVIAQQAEVAMNLVPPPASITAPKEPTETVATVKVEQPVPTDTTSTRNGLGPLASADPAVKPASQTTSVPLEKPSSVAKGSLGVPLAPVPGVTELPAPPSSVELPPPPPGLTPVLAAKPSEVPDRLKIPTNVPGAEVPPIDLPSPEPSSRKEREAAIRRLFPDLPPLGADPKPMPGPNGTPLTLGDLQKLALDNNPNLQQAAADVEAAHGRARQAGLWPNPVAGFEGDYMNTGGTAGYLGFFISQTIKTAGKPQLARAAALIDVLNAELALRRSEAELTAKVRGGYFTVLVAREYLKVSRALAEFADEIYRLQVELLKAAQSPPYESLQLRVLSTQSRASLIQAHNRYISAWKQLASALGVPAMPPTELAGSADMPTPQYDHQVVLERVLKAHTDVGTAVNAIQKAQIELKLAKLVPIPDVNFTAVVQRDQTTLPNETTFNVGLGVPIPVFDRNQGAIQAAEASLMRAEKETARVRNDLTARVAEAYERYDDNRRILELYRNSILPDQVRAYRALYLRHHREPDQVNLQDVVNAQQILAQSVTTYVGTLNALWTAVVDLSNLLQTTELYGDMGEKMPCNVPVLNEITADGAWK